MPSFADGGTDRPKNVCAHHVVASGDIRAEDSREVIFEFGIGINDADNGVYLPRFKNIAAPRSMVPFTPRATTRL
jgi:hypothetical protein